MAKTLPPLVFYENHLEPITLTTITALLPLLKKMGYGVLLFEPLFLFNSHEEEINTYRALPTFFKSYLYTKGYNRVQLFKIAEQCGFNLLSNDLNRVDFLEVIHGFIDSYHFTNASDVDPSLQLLFSQTKEQLKSCFHPHIKGYEGEVKENVRQVLLQFANILNLAPVAEKIMNHFMTEMFHFLSVTGGFKNCPISKNFMDRRTNNMAEQGNQYREDGVILICGYSHPCHVMIDGSLAYHLTHSLSFKAEEQFEPAASELLKDTNTQIIVSKQDHKRLLVEDLKKNMGPQHLDIGHQIDAYLKKNESKSWCPSFK